MPTWWSKLAAHSLSLLVTSSPPVPQPLGKNLLCSTIFSSLRNYTNEVNVEKKSVFLYTCRLCLACPESTSLACSWLHWQQPLDIDEPWEILVDLVVVHLHHWYRGSPNLSDSFPSSASPPSSCSTLRGSANFSLSHFFFGLRSITRCS